MHGKCIKKKRQPSELNIFVMCGVVGQFLDVLQDDTAGFRTELCQVDVL
jgi:hypothetical protein